MRALVWLLCIVTYAWTVNANVEKTIFLGPSPEPLPDVQPGLTDLRLDTLEPASFPILATQVSVKFPTKSAARGLESWYILRKLEEGRRYEVRICWPATQPTDFWLDTFLVSQVFNNQDLISSLADYSEQRQIARVEASGYTAGKTASSESILLLRVQAAASYYSTNRTLMEHPPPVDADIILDPFILNILPRSLGPTAIYICLVFVAAWFLAKYIYRWLLSVADEPATKDHKD